MVGWPQSVSQSHSCRDQQQTVVLSFALQLQEKVGEHNCTHVDTEAEPSHDQKAESCK